MHHVLKWLKVKCFISSVCLHWQLCIKTIKMKGQSKKELLLQVSPALQPSGCATALDPIHPLEPLLHFHKDAVKDFIYMSVCRQLVIILIINYSSINKLLITCEFLSLQILIFCSFSFESIWSTIFWHCTVSLIVQTSPTWDWEVFCSVLRCLLCPGAPAVWSIEILTRETPVTFAPRRACYTFIFD